MLTAYHQDLDDIPGTTVFTAQRARAGFHLNQFCMSLLKPENRTAFRNDEHAYLESWSLSDEQRAAVLARDYNALIALGGNFYFLYKIGATDGHSVQKVVGGMSGMSADEYGAMMLAGGRSPEGLRSKRENAMRNEAAR
jgi:protocatechuate 4,5-dioxygenase alpha chain